MTVGTPTSLARSAYSASSHLMKTGSDRPTCLIVETGMRHIHQPLYSASTRRCIHLVWRRFDALKSWRVGVTGPHMKFHMSKPSAYAWSLLLSYMSNMWPPTIVGVLA
ncbi:hypothetical protein BC477_19970 [Clavibacter michiganensis subsp. michiganensis]|uniref:Uncharacterized protein n=1 Tax=Clavibacter michiganensis subsp. michiganensis TaxID=33013 RepID=A0A251XCR9_CLAMM|nr:hypothetical protein BC477_19970 [Clavibacter michiganensis subsp. michiganensis]OUD99967.1 hypothetical protein CMMCAS07_19510 [Clavibacter michiganensis subsp. michiganensis]